MRPAPLFLSVEQVLAIHKRAIAEFGGDAGIRDHGLLQSAVTMPAAQVAGRFLHRDLAAMAAAYLFHLARNHPFVDGNKRTALIATGVFLKINGAKLRAANTALLELTERVAEGSISKRDAKAFLRKHLR